jgi:ribosomal protein L33
LLAWAHPHSTRPKKENQKKENMAKSKKGPRQPTGLKCSACNSFGYVTVFNKVNEQLKKQTTGQGTFPINKYCNVCRVHTEHVVAKKLK